MNHKRSLGVIGAVLLLTTACADVEDWWQKQWETGGGTWENPRVPWEQWDRDRAECRLVARQEAERDYALARQGGPAEDYSRLRPVTSQVDRFEAQRREETLYERCLSARGYRRVQRAEPSPRGDAGRTVPAP
jgi:hypothetical protein